MFSLIFFQKSSILSAKSEKLLDGNGITTKLNPNTDNVTEGEVVLGITEVPTVFIMLSNTHYKYQIFFFDFLFLIFEIIFKIVSRQLF